MIRNGQIQLIIGPMFAGKTTELLRRMRRYIYAKKNTILIKYELDTRYTKSSELVTHDGIISNSKTISTKELNNVFDQCKNVDVIGVDEGQFYPDLVQFCENMAGVMKKIVIVSALDSTFERKPFRDITKLVALSEDVVKLKSICNICHDDASFTRRFDMTNQDLHCIGGMNEYEPVCRSCFIKLNGCGLG